MKVILGKNKPIFTEIILLFIRQNTIPYGQRHYQCLMEFCLVFNLTMGGILAVTWAPLIATWYVSLLLP